MPQNRICEIGAKKLSNTIKAEENNELPVAYIWTAWILDIAVESRNFITVDMFPNRRNHHYSQQKEQSRP